MKHVNYDMEVVKLRQYTVNPQKKPAGLILSLRVIDVPDFFLGRGSKRPPRISKFFFREGVQGVQGVNRR